MIHADLGYGSDSGPCDEIGRIELPTVMRFADDNIDALLDEMMKSYKSRHVQNPRCGVLSDSSAPAPHPPHSENPHAVIQPSRPPGSPDGVVFVKREAPFYFIDAVNQNLFGDRLRIDSDSIVRSQAG